MRTRTGKAFLNMSTSLLGQIVTIVCGLITPRLILQTFGSTYNGVISSATNFLNMINILTFGITASTRVALYKPLAEGDALAVSALVKATKKYMRKIAAGVIVYAAVLCVVYPFVSQNTLSPLQSASLIAIVSIGTFANYFFGISDMTLLQAAQATYVTNISNIVKSVVNTLCVALLVGLGCSVYTVKLGSSLVFFVVPAVLSLYVRRKYALTNNCESNTAAIEGRKATVFHVVSNVIHDNVALVTLTFFTDAKIISVYTVYNLVVGKIKVLFKVLTSGMEAAFGDMWAKKELDKLNRHFSTYEYLLFTFTALVFSCVMILILPFIQVYTNGVSDANYIVPSLAVLITIAEAMYCVRQPYLTLVYSTGSFEETKWGALAEAIINIVVSVVLVNFIGVQGVIVGTLVANTFRTVQFAQFVSRHVLRRSGAAVLWRCLWLAGTFLITMVLAGRIKALLFVEVTWFGWLLTATAVFTAASVITVVMSLLFYKKDLQNLLKLFTGLLQRK